MAQQMPDMASFMSAMQNNNAGNNNDISNNSNNNSNNNAGAYATDFSALLAALQNNNIGMNQNDNNVAGNTAPGSNVQPPEERYASQLDALGDMGFVDRDQAVRALVRCNGNVNAAVELLLSGNI